ncbi:hypothetical protein AG74_156 [Vibrio phage AG74]|uniref:Uncharacterized protein n=2 Tax=Thalassavirus TaxID=2948922 RepID=A0A4Y6E7X3_9CAUD|nr:hypothetical protein KNU58_gp136 [Vibrio phage Brizo]YP_010108178.1 hypothetical protein KNV06_gp151 [Vibrio phage AG74]QDF14547.1 hypothetical protein BRIZO_150 [Vibrio phage Brizo]QKN84992.1 hypothetical protein AG74_156 [Vibrio phage AG74]
MSTELKDFLVENILPQYCEETNSFSPQIQEEYLTKEGWLDKAYICKSLKLHMSTATFRKVVKHVFDEAQFIQMPTETELTKEEFLEHYEFEKFPFGRGWIGYMYGLTGKVVKREDVFKWICSI